MKVNKTICTIISKNYLAHARVLTDTFLKHHPDGQVFVMLVDKVDEYYDKNAEKFTTIEIEELKNVPNIKQFIFKYSILELNTAVKPFFIEYLYEKYNLDSILYFDPDIMIMRPLDDIYMLLEKHSAVLTPHITMPFPNDDKLPNENSLLISGTYNLGFVGMGEYEMIKPLLDWWKDKLYDQCIAETKDGLFVDQKWMNLAPVMDEDIFILRGPEYNVAYWNLHERKVSFEDDIYYSNGVDISFYHFSGYDTNVESVSKYQNRYQLTDNPDLHKLFHEYKGLLENNGHEEIKKWPYYYGTFNNGISIGNFLRTEYFDMLRLSKRDFGNPFETNPGSFFHWLCSRRKAGSNVTNVLYKIYNSRFDLQTAFPDVWGKDEMRIVNWGRTNAQKEYGLDPKCFVPNDTNSFGVNLHGLFNTTSGIGQVARSMAKTLSGADIPLVKHSVEEAVFVENNVKVNAEKFQYNPYYFNLFNLNADITNKTINNVGQHVVKDKYNIGYWFWELSEFPEKWDSAFNHLDEIWVATDFCADAISKRTNIPVVKMPVPISFECPNKYDRNHFGIKNDAFVFFFMFDIASFLDRKNPMALIRSFKRAFSDSDNVQLVVKISNSEKDPKRREQLIESFKGYPIILIDSNLEQEELNDLINICDCYVSTHRSEGLGLTMAESMFLGKPVIATAYSGNMDFMNINNSYLLRYNLETLDEDVGPYEKGNVWASVDEDHLVETLRGVYINKDERESIGIRAKEDINNLFNYEQLGNRVKDRLELIYREKAEDTTIILPVYNSTDLTKQCIESVIENTEMDSTLLVINDASTEDEINNYLNSLPTRKNNVKIQLITNKQNVGFVHSVNRGIDSCAGNCVVLNSDTLVPKGWLKRLVYLNKKLPNVASITPYSNSGLLCSFPDFYKKNKLPAGVSHEDVDKAFQHLSPNEIIEIPTGVGFCMFMSRKVINIIGGFDVAFGKGYGEENDWCLRAKSQGFVNLHAQNLFVYHHNTGSFSQGEKEVLKSRNDKIKKERHPEFEFENGEFVDFDICKNNRNYVLDILKNKYNIQL